MFSKELFLEYLAEHKKFLNMDIKRPIKTISTIKDFKEVSYDMDFRKLQLGRLDEITHLEQMINEGEFDS